MTTKVYQNDVELAVSIFHNDQRIDCCILKETRELQIALYRNGGDEPVEHITLPLLPGIAVLGSFFSDPEVLLEMIGGKLPQLQETI